MGVFGKFKKMSFLDKVFKSGRKRKAAGSDSEKAIDNLKEMEELLLRKQLFLEDKAAQELENAKRHGKKNQRQALAALRRKKIHENDLTKVDSMLIKLEAQRTALENAGDNFEVLKVLESTNRALKNANKNFDIDKIQDIMEEIGDGLAVSDELARAISRPIEPLADEDELMSELLELEEEGKKKETIPQDPVTLPTVPRGPITRSRSRQESDLTELEQWAAAN